MRSEGWLMMIEKFREMYKNKLRKERTKAPE